MPLQAAERITAECEQHTAEIQNVFDKLLFLTSLQKWLGSRHRQLFDEWLSSPLEDQYNMLAPHYHEARELGTLSTEAFTLAAFSKLVPAGGVEEGARVLFYSNLDAILELLQDSFPASEQEPLAVSAASLPAFERLELGCTVGSGLRS